MNDKLKLPASALQSTYIFPFESSEEPARLLIQDQIITQAMGGAQTGLDDVPEHASILDLACGPGGWVLDVASARPDVQVCGIDINKATTDDAQERVVNKVTSEQVFR